MQHPQCYRHLAEEIKRRAEKYKPVKSRTTPYPYTGLITCSHCGKHYRRKSTATGPVWICSTYNSQGKAACPSKQIPERTMNDICAEINILDVSQIIACDENRLIFFLQNGSQFERTWNDRSRSESWTDEMKEKAREKRLQWQKNK